MNRFVKAVVAMKTAACMVLTAEMFFLLAAAFIFGLEAIPRDLALSLFLAALVIGAFQVLAFTELVIRRLAYTWRVVLFIVPLFGVLAGIGVYFQWFPAGEPGAWGLFALIFLAIFLFIFLGFEIYYRVTGRKYDGLLGQYRKSREQRK